MQIILAIAIIHGFIMINIKKYVRIQWLNIVLKVVIILQIQIQIMYILLEKHYNALINALKSITIHLILIVLKIVKMLHFIIIMLYKKKIPIYVSVKTYGFMSQIIKYNVYLQM